MRPGQISPNELELAILRRLFEDDRDTLPHPEQLHVLSREYTGAGSYTTFKRNATDSSAPDTRRGLYALISVPGVTNGLGAFLSLKGNVPDCLEVYTYGTELWDGVFEGFSIERSV